MRVEETMDLVASSLGVRKMDVLVSPNVIIVTTDDGTEFRTKARRVSRMHVQMALLNSVMQWVAQLGAGQLTAAQYRQGLDALSHPKPEYNAWLVAAMVGVACAGFCAIVRGALVSDPITHPSGLLDLFSTFVGSSLAMLLRQQMLKKKLNLLMNAFVSGFVAFAIAGVVARAIHAPNPDYCAAASVLFLVPGVPLLNAIDELFSGGVVIGLSRGIQTVLVFIAIAISVLSANLALKLAGLS